MPRNWPTKAEKPNARLVDITYCWEAIGSAALPFISKLITDPSPKVAFAAARAGAFIGDPTEASQSALLQMVHARPPVPTRIGASAGRASFVAGSQPHAA